MTGFWLLSYIILWLLVGVLCLVTFGLLQQLGLLQQRLEQHNSGQTTEKKVSHPALEEDGPDIGSTLHSFTEASINGFGSLSFPLSHEGYSLLMFLSPLCETCQSIVEMLNIIAEKNVNIGKVVVIMRSDEQACRAFISIFPLHFPVICDSKRIITMDFQVHHAPFGLIYDSQGILVRKGGIKSQKDLSTLLGDMFQLRPVTP